MNSTRSSCGRSRRSPIDLVHHLFHAVGVGGSYFPAADADGMKQVMDQINQLEKTTIEQPKYIEFREYAPRLALVALGLLLLGFIADTTWCMRLP